MIAAAARTLAELRALGARLDLAGDRVRVQGVPADRLPAELVARARAQRRDLAALLHAEVHPLGTCRACGERMPRHHTRMCFCCWYGLDRSDFNTTLMPIATELVAARGPAGGRGLRVAEIQAIARQRRRAARRILQ